MKKILSLMVFAFLVSGCTFTSVNKMAPGEYGITVHGSPVNTYKYLVGRIEKKAAGLCGEDGYSLEGAEGVAYQPLTSHYNGQQIHTSAAIVTRVVRCNKELKESEGPPSN